jgi:hypothetical protein
MLKIRILIVFMLAILIHSCKKIEEFNQDPELTPLEQGFKASAAIGFCASLVNTAFSGGDLPSNVVYNPDTKDGFTNAGLLYVNVDAAHPLPFNSNIGDIAIAALWNGNSGVISILFADIDVISSQFEFYGLYTIPMTRDVAGNITVIFVEQDIIVGEGQDTLINLSLSKPKFDAVLADPVYPTYNSISRDPFVAAKQNVWFISVDQNGTPSDLYDELYEVTGGGQIVEVSSNSGGILYHALIKAKFSYANCELNPTSGGAFIQNLKAGTTVDLGNITLEFHTDCDGRAPVFVATGKYISSNGKNILLGWN